MRFGWLLMLSIAGCLVDDDDRCGAGQEYDGTRCVCEPGFGLVGHVCADDSAPCKEAGALGIACTDDTDCTDPAYDLCVLDGDAGYCTKRDCSADVQCDTAVDCKSDPDKCHGDWVCCDIPILSNSICIPPAEIVDGACPVGGSLIPRSK